MISKIVPLLVVDNSTHDVIPKSMQLIAGKIGQDSAML